MKKLLFVSLVIMLVALVGCKKEQANLPTVGKMRLPASQLIQGSEMITKSGGTTVTQMVYEFWAQKNGVWVPCDDSFYKDGSAAQAANNFTWTEDYCPNNTCQQFVDVPLNLPLKIVLKAKDESGKVKFYGVALKTFTVVNIGQITVNCYEVDSRLYFNVSDLLKNSNWEFTFNFTWNVLFVDYNSIIQGTTWLEGAAANSRGWNMVPLLAGAMPVNNQLVVNGASQTVKLNGIALTATGGKYLLSELIGSGSTTQAFTTNYSIKRLSDGTMIETNKPVTAVETAGIPSGFPTLNWLNPGYNYTITVTSDPQKLGSGQFCGTLTENNDVTGTVNL